MFAFLYSVIQAEVCFLPLKKCCVILVVVLCTWDECFVNKPTNTLH